MRSMDDVNVWLSAYHEGESIQCWYSTALGVAKTSAGGQQIKSDWTGVYAGMALMLPGLFSILVLCIRCCRGSSDASDSSDAERELVTGRSWSSASGSSDEGT
mmetsp:Transcript_96212/g.220593  ORF Transcript_96212/g.220593 Transcript_96212/m.220593 type:complete len:103 (-) Transcript_96212:73-381(-)